MHVSLYWFFVPKGYLDPFSNLDSLDPSKFRLFMIHILLPVKCLFNGGELPINVSFKGLKLIMALVLITLMLT